MKLDLSYWRRLWQQASSSKIDEEELQRHLREARAALPAPVFWLLGKAQSGKTSVVRALTGNSQAEIGGGFRPHTRHSRMYAFPNDEECFLRFLDTRGLGEVEYDLSGEVENLESIAHLLIVVVKAMDHAQECVLGPLREICGMHPKWPVIVLQTVLHEGYPTADTRHPRPYPFDTFPYPSTVPADLSRSLAAQRALFERQSARFVPIDFTLPEDGFDPEFYGVEALWAAIEEVLPLGLRAMLEQDKDARRAFRDEHYRAARPQVLFHALAAGGAGAVPIPVVDVPLVLALQARLFHTIATIYGQPMNVQRMAEISSALGVSLVGRLGVRGLLKFLPIPGVGSTVTGIYAAASTYALGNALCEYFSRVLDGDVPDAAALRDLYAEEFERGKRWLATRLAEQAPTREPRP